MRFLCVCLLLFPLFSMGQVPDMPATPMPERYLTLMPKVAVTRMKDDLVFTVNCTAEVSAAYLTAGFMARPDVMRPTYRIDTSAVVNADSFELKLPLRRIKKHFTGDQTLLYYKLNLTAESGKPESYESRVLLNQVGNPLPTVMYGPYLDRPEQTSYVISFEMSEPVKAAVVLDGKRFASEQVKTRHEIPVGDIKPGIHRYHIEGDPRTFQFRIRNDGPFRFAVMSDSRTVAGGAEYNLQAVNGKVLGDLMLDAYQQDLDLIVFPGDLVDGYTQMEDEFERELKSWAWATEPVSARVPVFEGIGNHEALVVQYAARPYIFFDRKPPHSTEDVFGRVFVNPVNGDFSEKDGLPSYRENLYFFEMRGCLFIMANSNYWVGGEFPEKHGGNLEGHIMDRQMDWLRRVLKEQGPKARHIFFFTHEPAYPVSEHMKDGMWYWGGDPKQNDGIDRSYIVKRRDELIQLLADHGVQLIFFGDEHNYSRIRIDHDIADIEGTITQVITGGAGAPYYELADEIPWRDNLEKFGRENHYVLVDVKDTIRVRVISITGHLIDSFSIQ